MYDKGVKDVQLDVEDVGAAGSGATLFEGVYLFLSGRFYCL